MSKPFDAMLKTLIDGYEANWAEFFGARAGMVPGLVTSLDTDLSSTLQADRLFRIDGPTPAVLHLELESTGKLGRPAQLLRYNIAAWAATDQLPVHSVLIVLRPKANASDLTGQFELLNAHGQPYLTFRYTVVRLWQESAEIFMTAGPGIVPLALLTDDAGADLVSAFRRFQKRLLDDMLSDKAERELMLAAYVLCGLRYTSTVIEELFRETTMTLEDSTTYQLILSKGRAEGKAEGKAEEAQKMLLRFARKRFGSMPVTAEATLLAISDLDRLERMADRLDQATGWDDLLGTL